jgi:hypothetical protein
VSGGSAGARAVLGGKAVVCCVHDREKRVVTTEAHVAALALEHGILYDPKQHRIHDCACCHNRFWDPSDEPRYCWVCRWPPVFALGGPLATATGPVDG